MTQIYCSPTTPPPPSPSLAPRPESRGLGNVPEPARPRGNVWWHFADRTQAGAHLHSKNQSKDDATGESVALYALVSVNPHGTVSKQARKGQQQNEHESANGNREPLTTSSAPTAYVEVAGSGTGVDATACVITRDATNGAGGRQRRLILRGLASQQCSPRHPK